MWQVVYICNTEAEAGRIAKKLEQESIMVKVQQSGAISFQIMVLEAEVEDATEIIHEMIG